MPEQGVPLLGYLVTVQAFQLGHLGEEPRDLVVAVRDHEGRVSGRPQMDLVLAAPAANRQVRGRSGRVDLDVVDARSADGGLTGFNLEQGGIDEVRRITTIARDASNVTVRYGSDAAVACDHYHRWQDDIEVMQSLNLNAYRFSIAWPRIIPDGDGEVNEAGLDWYSDLVFFGRQFFGQRF